MSLRTSYKARRIALRIFMFLILAIFIVWTVTPIYIIVSNSFRKTIEMKVMPPKFIFEPTFTHYEKILTLDRFGVFFRNSIIISCFSTFLCIMLGSLAAYVSRGGSGKFQPMNANFGLIKPLEKKVKGGKPARNQALYERGMSDLEKFAEESGL